MALHAPRSTHLMKAADLFSCAVSHRHAEDGKLYGDDLKTGPSYQALNAIHATLISDHLPGSTGVSYSSASVAIPRIPWRFASTTQKKINLRFASLLHNREILSQLKDICAGLG